jgi:hypothetical protein
MVEKQMAQLNSQLEKFLFEVIGEDQGGSPLTVISALARRGKDPWAEAVRLAELTEADAKESLNAVIADIPPSWCGIPDRKAAVLRLIKLLPRRIKIPAAKSRLMDFRSRHETRFLAVISLVLLVTVIVAYAFA